MTSLGLNELTAGVLFATSLAGATPPYTGTKLLAGAASMQLLLGHFQQPMFLEVADVE